MNEWIAWAVFAGAWPLVAGIQATVSQVGRPKMPSPWWWPMLRRNATAATAGPG